MINLFAPSNGSAEFAAAKAAVDFVGLVANNQDFEVGYHHSLVP